MPLNLTPSLECVRAIFWNCGTFKNIIKMENNKNRNPEDEMMAVVSAVLFIAMIFGMAVGAVLFYLISQIL